MTDLLFHKITATPVQLVERYVPKTAIDEAALDHYLRGPHFIAVDPANIDLRPGGISRVMPAKRVR